MFSMRQLAIRALRKAGVVSEIMPTANAYDADVAMDTAIAMYARFIGNGLWGPITNVIATEDYTAGENERVVNTSETVINITLPATIEDSSSGTTVTRTPEDRAFVLVSGAEPQAYVYDADLADWVSLYDLTLDDNAPLTGRYGSELIAILAGEISDERGLEPGPVLAALIRSGLAALRLKRPRRVTAEGPVLRGISQRGFC